MNASLTASYLILIFNGDSHSSNGRLSQKIFLPIDKNHRHAIDCRDCLLDPMRMGSELLSMMKKFTPDLAKVFSTRMS